LIVYFYNVLFFTRFSRFSKAVKELLEFIDEFFEIIFVIGFYFAFLSLFEDIEGLTDSDSSSLDR